jgi:NADH-dependent peroxiredoxin subunit F
MYDLTIIGGGPAGVAAGVYAARKRLKTLFLTESFGGQSTESVGVENWIGTVHIHGMEFGKALENHLRAYAGDIVDIRLERVTGVEKGSEGFIVKTSQDAYKSKVVLVATGSTRRKLRIPGGKEFENKGITYCASCDGPLFTDQDVVVIGGGNAGFESAAQLLAYARSVTLLNRSDSFKADESTVEKVTTHPNMKVLKNAVPKEVKGTNFVESLVYTDTKTGEDHELKVSGIFVEIGLIPTTDFVKDVVRLNELGQIPIDPRTSRTDVQGIWAAGDCTDTLYHQNNIAAGDAVRALEDIYLYLKAGK